MNNRYLVTILSCVAISAPTVAKSNVINVSAGSSSDYSYITKVINSDDSLSSVYYKLNINKDELSSSQNIIWNLGTSAETDKNFTITLPQNDNKNYFYTKKRANRKISPLRDLFLTERLKSTANEVHYRTTLVALLPCFMMKIPFSGLATFIPCKL